MRIGKNQYILKLVKFQTPKKYLRPAIYSLLFATSFVLFIYTSLFFSSMCRHFSVAHFIILSYIWQTLISGAFAISAAILGVSAILYQTEQARQADEYRRKRRADALTATFALALSELCDYASTCAKINAGLLQNSAGSTIKCPELQFPSLPPGLIQGLSDLIEVSEEAHSKPLIDLVRRVQIVSARMADVQRRATGPSTSLLLPTNLIARTIDAAEIFARAGVLLGYVRRAAASPAEPVTFQDVRRALITMPSGISNFQLFQDAIERRFEANGKNPEWPEG